MNITLGTVSHGTMRPEDLIPCFISAIREILARNAQTVILTSMDGLEGIIKNTPDYYQSDDCMYDLDMLFDTLNTLAPDGYYFGAHPGDGSDYGFWECEE